jgi:hypothetical protein
MNIFTRNKILGFLALFFLTIATYAASTSFLDGKAIGSDNIILVRKHVFANPQRMAESVYAQQKQCLELKAIAYKESGLVHFAPLQEEKLLSIDEIVKLQNITVTEYFRGSNYAKHIKGNQLDTYLRQPNGEKRKQEEFDCRVLGAKINTIEIITNSKSISVNNLANNGQGEVIYTNRDSLKPKTNAGFKAKHFPKDLSAIKLPNSTTECLTKPGLIKCYLKSIPVHFGTDREVDIHNFVPEKGQNPFHDSFMSLPVSVGFTNGDIFKIFEFISVEIAKDVPNSAFEVPAWASAYKAVTK